MQTFLPYPSFIKSARCLDNKRLGKQRVEAMQILNTLSNGNRWKNHPAVLMWKGYENALKLYMNECIKEWIKRGFKNNMKFAKIPFQITVPKWLGNDKFHSSHRSNLLRKNKEYYNQFGWKDPDNLSYFWPTKNGY